MIKTVNAIAIGAMLSAVAVGTAAIAAPKPASAPAPARVAVEIAPHGADRTAIGYVVERVPADWENILTEGVRISVGSPNMIAFYSGRVIRNPKSGVDAILVKKGGKWQVAWAIHVDTTGASTCQQVVDHMARAHSIAQQYGVDPDLMSAQFQNWEKDNRRALRAKGAAGCSGSL
jgi:hypothetical protein